MDLGLLARPRGASLIARIVVTALLLLPTLALRPAGAAPFERWAYYVKTDPYSLTSLEIAAKRLQVVVPYYFDVDAEGLIKGTDDPGITKLIRAGGARVIPMVQNEARWEALSPLLREPPKRAVLTDRLLNLVTTHNYDGIQIDFEWIEEGDRDYYTQFLAELKGKLQPIGKHLSVAVPDKPFEGFSRWSAAYDYAGIGRVADSVVIMAYGYRTTSTEPGSYAPAAWVQSVAKYATSQIPHAKLLLGIGLWAYDWELRPVDTHGTARRTRDVLQVGREKGYEFGYDELEQSAWAKYVGADGAQHIVWYEDKRAVEAKTKLAGSFGMLGTALWRLGQEDPALWEGAAAAPVQPSPVLPVTAPAATPAAQPVSPPSPNPPAPQPSPPAAVTRGLGRFFTETGGGNGKGFLVHDGAAQPNGIPIRFWGEYERLGGVAVLGFPISERYVGPDGFTYQAFQRAVLQWRPEQDRALFANTFNILQAAGKDDWLAQAKGIPPTKEDESGGDWNVAKTVRFAWLTNEAIATAYLANPNPAAFKEWSEWDAIQLYGLPMSEPQRAGPFISQRFQRITLQLWVEDVQGMPAKGTVVAVLGGDLLKEAGLIPASATEPRLP